MPDNEADDQGGCPADERAALRAWIEGGLALQRVLREGETPSIWPQELLAKARLHAPPEDENA